MQKIQEKTEYIGDLRAEFQEIDSLYEHERADADILSLSVQCFAILSLICC